MRVAAIQHDIVWEDPSATFHHVAPLITVAADEGARLAVLTEMYSTGFSMQPERVAESADGPSTSFLVEQAARHDLWMCASVPVRAPGADRAANMLVLAAPDGAVHRYRKIHPFTYSGEHEHYAAGDEFLTVDVDGVRCSFFVCYDLRFADEFWQLAHTTDCYVIPANWPASRRAHWSTLLAARAIENQAYVVGVNRIGHGGANGEVEYGGGSAIVDPFGIVLAESIGHEEAVLIADVDPERVADVRAKYPFLADRRESK
ncbi:MAG: carbon-nitrogen family hydrolase [Acidimicrobiia bacterium]